MSAWAKYQPVPVHDSTYGDQATSHSTSSSASSTSASRTGPGGVHARTTSVLASRGGRASSSRDSFSTIMYEKEQSLLRPTTTEKIRSNRRNRLIVISAVVSILFIALAYQKGPATIRGAANYYYTTPKAIDPWLLPSKRFTDLANGRWTRQKGPYTQEDALRDYGSRVEDHAAPDRGEEFALSIAAWKWIPDLPEGMRVFDGFEFAKRLLNAEIGLLLVGDSLSKQTALVTGGMNRHGMLRVTKNGFYEGPRRERAPYVYVSDSNHPSQLVEIALYPNSSWYDRMARELPNVPRERLLRPFVTMVRHDTLVNLDRVVEIADSIKPAITREAREMNVALRQHEWHSYLEPLSNERSWEGQQNSIIVFNDGAHFSNADLGIADPTELAKVISGIASDIVTYLTAIPNLDVIFRSTAPGQPYCFNYTKPVFPGMAYTGHPEFPEWGWQHFNEHNALWARELDAQAPEGRTKDGSGAVVYLDVSEMTSQRPDARMVKRIKSPDCLHWQVPGVTSHWVRMIWHVIGDNDQDNDVDVSR